MPAQNEDGLPPVRLITLGGLRLETQEAALPPGLASGKPLALLAYLSLHTERGVTRDDLADLLWEDRDLKAGRRVLRQVLYIVKKGLGPDSLESSEDTVRVSSFFRSDVQEFEIAVRTGDHRAAIEFHRGLFLHGFELPGAGRFSRWVDRERSRLFGMFTETALALADEASRVDDWAFVLQVLEQILDCESEHIVARCRRIEALDASGRTVEAAAAAHEFNKWIKEEGESVPTWARSTIARLTSPRGPVATVERGNELLRPAFSGRGAEYRVLLKQWQAVGSGEGRIALVIGDPGIGKTRLIEELLWVAEQEGGRILRGKSYELEDGLLFGALVDVVTQAIASPGFAAVSDVWVGELARLVPELLEQYPGLSVPSSHAGTGRRRFHEAVAQVLDALAYEGPVVCVLDDLHWADDATLELVHYLARRLCATPVLLIVALRPGEASETLLRLQKVLETEHGGVSISLSPLSRESVSDIVTSMAYDVRPPPAIENTLWEASSGNPFLAVSVLRALVGTGSVQVNPDGWEMDADTMDPSAPSDGGFLLRSLVAELPKPSMRLLELAAIVGRTFTSDQLAAASEENPESARIRLEALESRCVLRSERSGGVTRFDFMHDRMRQFVYESIPKDQLVELHGRVARAGDGAVGLNSCIQARHFHQAAQRDEAYRHALTGAEWAKTVFAHGGEREMLQLALENAPDADSREALEKRLSVLGPSHAKLGTATNRPSRLRRLRWPAAVAAAFLLVAFPPNTWSDSLAEEFTTDPRSLAPLPVGILVEVDSPRGMSFAVIDLASPAGEMTLIPAATLSRPVGATNLELMNLSPDAEWIAYTDGEKSAPDVWVQQRNGGSRKQVTKHPADDVLLDWAPDGTGLLIRTRRNVSSEDKGAAIALAGLDGSGVRILTVGPADHGTARFSPTGSRIAFTKRSESSGIWIMDADGSDPEELFRGQARIGSLAWAPDESRIAFTESLSTGTRLSVIDLVSRNVQIMAEGVTVPILWSEDGTVVYVTSTRFGSSDIVAIPIDGGPPSRITFSGERTSLFALLGTRAPFISSVDITPNSDDELGLLEGDTIAVEALVWLSDGRPSAGRQAALHCVDTTICQAVDGTRIRGVRAGQTALVAEIGGWRADTIVVRVAFPTATLVFEEGWEQGIDPLRWTAYGDPHPEVRDGVGPGEGSGFVSNGDASYTSGVVSTQPIDLRGGLTIEFWARGDFGTDWPSYEGFRVSLAREPLDGAKGDVTLSLSITLGVARETRGAPISLIFGPVYLEEDARWSPRDWHQYALQVVPGGRCEVWIDGEKRLTYPCNALPTRETWIEIGGRTSGGLVIHGEVKVWQGVKWR